MKKTKKRNPQDSTRRNVQAANKRIEILEKRITILEIDFMKLSKKVACVGKVIEVTEK